MSMAYLGPSFDIHTGGVDLIFPHHEDEIAQSEAATGQPFVGTWLHCAHLQMGGEKMAKSTGNIARVGELLEAGVSPRALRYALIAVHYRAGAQPLGGRRWPRPAAALERLDAASPPSAPTRGPARRPDAARRARRPSARRSARPSTTTSTCPPALAVVFDLVREAQPAHRGAQRCRPPTPTRVIATLRDLDQVLGILPPVDEALPDRPARRCSTSEPRPAPRATGRPRIGCATSWPSVGVLVEDTRDGQRWRRLAEASRG